MELNPRPLVQIRCRKTVYLKTDGTPFVCNRLMAEIEEGSGVIVCPRCKHKNYFEVKNAQSAEWYNRNQKDGDPHIRPMRGQN